jgi:hypothetical protein
MKKIYNVVCISGIGDGANIFNETYFYDWGSIPDVPYYVSFAFVSGALAMTTNASPPAVYVDLSQVNNQLATSSTTSNSRGQFLGNLRYMLPTGTNVLYADPNSNPSSYLNGRPNNNYFTVQILSNPTTNFTECGPYSLTISLLEA